MKVEDIDVAIIGAGTAGLVARAEVAKVTDRYRIFDPGPYGTSCVRTACMPSKAFLQSAHDFHRRHSFGALGIVGAERLSVDARRVLAETRALRDGLAEGVLADMAPWRDAYLVPHAPVFDADGILWAQDSGFRPRATVIATGSRPMVPEKWRDRFGDRILTSDDIFDLDTLPRRMAVVGLGPVGVELGQALARLGVVVTGFDPSPMIAGLADPDLQARLRAALAGEFSIVQAQAAPEDGPNGAITMRWEGGEIEVDGLLVAIGRTPNRDRLGLDRLAIDLGRQWPADRQLNLPGTRLYFAGDAGHGPALLHEAADEGRIAGYYAARDADAVFQRHVPLRIVFCDPQIALAGATWDELEARGDAVIVGKASFDRSGRTQLQRESGGAVRIYAERRTGRLLGAALVGPAAEHLAHLLAFAIGREDDIGALLQMPAYHPTHEEVLRRALRSALRECDVEAEDLEAMRCEATPIERAERRLPELKRG